MKSFTPQTTTLVVRDSYWQDLPKVKELRYTSYNDNNAQTTALADGSAEGLFVFIPNYKAVFTDKDPAHYKVWAPPVLGIHGLYINTTQKPFDDPALRALLDALKAVERVDYTYRRGGRQGAKTVHFYLCDFDGRVAVVTGATPSAC